MQQLLEGLVEQLDISVASASVGPAPEGIPFLASLTAHDRNISLP